MFRRALVEDPHGWSESGPPGSARYTDADLDRLLGADADATVLLYVGSFLAFKRVPLLVRAFAQTQSHFSRPASLLVWGGHPGEWEGEHPVTVTAKVGARDIYFTGWRGHDDLAEGLSDGDALIVPSVDDPYRRCPSRRWRLGFRCSRVAAAESSRWSISILSVPRAGSDRLVPHFEAVYSQTIHHNALDSR